MHPRRIRGSTDSFPFCQMKVKFCCSISYETASFRFVRKNRRAEGSHARGLCWGDGGDFDGWGFVESCGLGYLTGGGSGETGWLGPWMQFKLRPLVKWLHPGYAPEL